MNWLPHIVRQVHVAHIAPTTSCDSSRVRSPQSVAMRQLAGCAMQAASLRGVTCAAGSRLFSSASGSAPPLAAAAAGAGGEASEDERAASLPVAQLAKALLAGNVRGQLTTITAGEPGQDESKVVSSVAAYLSPRGSPPLPGPPAWCNRLIECLGSSHFESAVLPVLPAV